MARVVVGMYEDVTAARDAVRELIEQGFERDALNLIVPDPQGDYARAGAGRAGGLGVVAGTAAGAALGGIAGLLASLSALVIPGIGPVVGGGAIVSTLIGAGAGAATGLIGALVDAGLPPDEAGLYAEGLRQGHSLLIVQRPGLRHEEAVAILQRHGPIQVEQRSGWWREQGIGAEPGGDVETDRGLGGYTMQQMDDLLSSDDRDTGVYVPGSDSHYQTQFTDRGRPYEYYEPAYRYGYRLAAEGRYAGCDWNEVEPEVRRGWETERRGPWDDLRDAVRYGWESGCGHT